MIVLGIAISYNANAAIPSNDNQNISSSIPTASPTIKAGTGYIELIVSIEETTTFYIYSITGQLIKTITVSSGNTIVELPRGYYIVKCEKWSKQAVVR